jgi:CheY-like chemotaxis protein
MVANPFNVASVSALLSAVVSLVGGVGARVLGGAPDWEDVRPLGRVGFTAAAIAACNFPATLDVAPAIHAWSGRVQVLAIALHVAAWYAYLLQWGSPLSRRARWAIFGTLLGAGALALVPGVVYGDTVTLRPVAWLGVGYHDRQVTATGLAVLAVIAAFGAGGVARLAALRGRGVPFHRTLVVVTTLLLGMGVHDAVVVGGLSAPTPYLLDFGLYGPALAIAVQTLRRVVASAKDLHDLRTGLEVAVFDRTWELEHSQAALVRQLGVAGRAGRGAVPAGPRVDVRVARAVEAALATARARGFREVVLGGQVAPGLTVSGHEEEVFELVETLVLHALEGFRRGEAGAVSVRAEAKGDWVLLTIEDDGAPLSEEALRHAFEPFRGNARGSGLLLAVARGLAERMGGELRIESHAPERGVRVAVELARGVPEPSIADLPGAPLAAPRRARILVVDRDPRSLAALARWLAADHEVEAASALREALSALADRSFDLVLCDAALPGGGAERFWEEVLLRAPTMQGRVVFLAGGAEPPAVVAFLARQPRPVVRRPPDRGEVSAALGAAGFVSRGGAEVALPERVRGEVVGKLRGSEGSGRG